MSLRISVKFVKIFLFGHLVVHYGDCLEFAVTEPVYTVVSEGQLPVASFDTRTGSLKQLSEIQSHLLDPFDLLGSQSAQGAIGCPQRSQHLS